MHESENKIIASFGNPLKISATNDHFLAITKEFITLGMPCNKFTDKHFEFTTPIGLAIRADALKTIKLLIYYGANLFPKTKHGYIKKHGGAEYYYDDDYGPPPPPLNPKTLIFAEREFALRMLLLCGHKKECIIRFVPKDVLKMIAERIH